MEKLNKLSIKSENIIEKEKLSNIFGGVVGNPSGVIKCYREGWISGCMGLIATFGGPCSEALFLCNEIYGGSCVEC